MNVDYMLKQLRSQKERDEENQKRLDNENLQKRVWRLRKLYNTIKAIDCERCGSADVEIETINKDKRIGQQNYFYRVYCKPCRNRGPIEFTLPEAFEAWNKLNQQKARPR